MCPGQNINRLKTKVVLFYCFFPRHHTLAFAPSSGVVYAFGCNSHGQLGTGILGNTRSPFPVKTRFQSGNFHSTGKEKTQYSLYSYGLNGIFKNKHLSTATF